MYPTPMLFLVAAIAMAESVPRVSQAQVVADDRFENSTNLVSFSSNPPPGSYTSVADGFEVYQFGVSTSIPQGLIDESFGILSGDNLGIFDGSTNSPGYDPDNAWFGVIDTVNPDNLPVESPGNATATWTFDIRGAATANLDVSIDMAAMGDFDNEMDKPIGQFTRDHADWSYFIDDGEFLPLFSSSLDLDGNLDYIMADGHIVNQNDPMLMTNVQDETVMLNNDLQTLSSTIAANSGSTLTVRLAARLDVGGGEIFGFDNIVVSEAEIDVNGVPGDFSDNGETEVDDLNLVLFNWGRRDEELPGDWANERPIDGTVDIGELNQVLFNWGSSTPSPTINVPEPVSAYWLVMATVIPWQRRRHGPWK